MKILTIDNMLMLFLTAIVTKTVLVDVNVATSVLGVGILVGLVIKSYISLRLAKEVSVDQRLNGEIKELRVKLDKNLNNLEEKVLANAKIVEDRVKSIEARNSMTELARTVRPR